MEAAWSFESLFCNITTQRHNTEDQDFNYISDVGRNMKIQPKRTASMQL
jgi:hypothetical protein